VPITLSQFYTARRQNAPVAIRSFQSRGQRLGRSENGDEPRGIGQAKPHFIPPDRARSGQGDIKGRFPGWM